MPDQSTQTPTAARNAGCGRASGPQRYGRPSPHAKRWLSMPLDELHKHLVAERKRGIDGHWAYDLPRHRAMLEVYRERSKP